MIENSLFISLNNSVISLCHLSSGFSKIPEWKIPHRCLAKWEHHYWSVLSVPHISSIPELIASQPYTNTSERTDSWEKTSDLPYSIILWKFDHNDCYVLSHMKTVPRIRISNMSSNILSLSPSTLSSLKWFSFLTGDKCFTAGSSLNLCVNEPSEMRWSWRDLTQYDRFSWLWRTLHRFSGCLSKEVAALGGHTRVK